VFWGWGFVLITFSLSLSLRFTSMFLFSLFLLQLGIVSLFVFFPFRLVSCYAFRLFVCGWQAFSLMRGSLWERELRSSQCEWVSELLRDAVFLRCRMYVYMHVCLHLCVCVFPFASVIAPSLFLSLSRFLSHSLSSFLLRRGENVLEFGFVLRWEVVFVWFPFGSMGLFVWLNHHLLLLLVWVCFRFAFLWLWLFLERKKEVERCLELTRRLHFRIFVCLWGFFVS
jgi:hypothetical protein